MTAATKKITIDEYLEMERRSETKHEYFAGEVYAMAGASFAHVTLSHNLDRVLGNALLGQQCHVCANELRVRTQSTLYTYPDIVVACGPPQFADDQEDTLTNPLVIFEILSDSTEAYDRGTKFLHYQSIPSLKEYVLVSQKLMLVEHFTRQPDGKWLFASFRVPDDAVSFPSLRISVVLRDIYARVEMSRDLPLKRNE